MAKTKRKTKADLEAEVEELGSENERHKAENKKQRTAISSVAKEFVCPISFELPVDPVTAADGRVYNRASIQGHIDRAKKDKKEPKSPITNEKMNDTLVPAIQVTNMIRTLIESGAVGGDLAKQWKMVDDMKKKAENGDAKAMFLLGNWHIHGTSGFLRDEEAGYSWYTKSAELGYVSSIFRQGFCLMYGVGVSKSTSEGSMLLGLAAKSGSDAAAFTIGQCYFLGCSGFPKNKSKAKKWFRKVVDGSCSVKHISDGAMKDARKYLEEIEDGSVE